MKVFYITPVLLLCIASVSALTCLSGKHINEKEEVECQDKDNTCHLKLYSDGSKDYYCGITDTEQFGMDPYCETHEDGIEYCGCYVDKCNESGDPEVIKKTASGDDGGDNSGNGGDDGGANSGNDDEKEDGKSSAAGVQASVALMTLSAAILANII